MKEGRPGSDGERVWHGPCPFEKQGTDRFTVFERGNFKCRRCGESGFITSAKRSPEEIAAWAAKQKELEEKEARERMNRLLSWQDQDHETAINLWHSFQVDYWRREGIPGWAVEQYRFGYCPDKMIRLSSGQHASVSAFTMPIYHPVTHKLENIQYRIDNPPRGEGKYRQEDGIPASAAFMNGDFDGEAVFVEGYKKAIVVYNLLKKTRQVVGFPSNLPGKALVESRCQTFKKIYLIFDPGSDQQILRMARLLPGKIWDVGMPVKPDDAIVKFGLKENGFQKYLDYAERVI